MSDLNKTLEDRVATAVAGTRCRLIGGYAANDPELREVVRVAIEATLQSLELDAAEQQLYVMRPPGTDMDMVIGELTDYICWYRRKLAS